MLDYKEFAENILSDIMNNSSLSDVLLKMKILASVREDEVLLDWVNHELAGYEKKPPKYRILTSGLKVKVFVPFKEITTIEFPAEAIKNEQVKERLSKIPFHNPIAEIESICKDAESTVSMHVPVGIYGFLSEYINGDIQDVYQYTTKAALTQILVSVKSVLIDFLLSISNQEDINFNTFIKSNPNMIENVTINAGVVNTGSGNVNAQGATTIVGNDNVVNEENKKELLQILAEIEILAATTQPDPDYDEIVKDIKEELSKEKPAKKFLKRCFQAIPSFLTGLTSSIMANGLSPLISSALALL